MGVDIIIDNIFWEKKIMLILNVLEGKEKRWGD